MIIVIFTYSALLLLTALVGFVASGATTSLIPGFFGIIFIALGLLALKERFTAMAMHTALVVAIVVIFGTAGSLNGFARILIGEEVTRPLAVILQTLTFIISLIFIFAGFISFRNARRKRKAMQG